MGPVARYGLHLGNSQPSYLMYLAMADPPYLLIRWQSHTSSIPYPHLNSFPISLPCNHPLNGSTCCPKTACLQSGHSGFSSTQSNIHVQQNTCPHVVTLGSFIGSRQSVHFRVCFGCSHASVEGSESSYRCGVEGGGRGVCVVWEIRRRDVSSVFSGA